jgi:hypothetical protein
LRTTLNATKWGVSGDIPAVGDYNGDAREDFAVFRPSTGVWYVLNTTGSVIGIAGFGVAGDLPAPKYDRP